MKTHFAAICIFFVVACRQATSDVMNPLDPLGIYRTSIDPAALFVTGQSLDLPNAVGVSVKTQFPLDEPFPYPADRGIVVPGDNLLGRMTHSIRSSSSTFFNSIKKLVLIPIKVIEFLLAPVIITFNIVKFFIRLFFLPVMLGWNMFKLFLFPAKFLLRQLASPPPTPPYVIGVPNNPSLTPYPMFTSK